MSPAIITALSTILGAIISGLVSLGVATMQHNKTEAVVVEKIAQLEKRVDKHNDVVMRTFTLEANVKNLQEDIKELKH